PAHEQTPGRESVKQTTSHADDEKCADRFAGIGSQAPALHLKASGFRATTPARLPGSVSGLASSGLTCRRPSRPARCGEGPGNIATENVVLFPLQTKTLQVSLHARLCKS